MAKTLYKKVTIRKKNFYTWLKDTLISVGWENISSRPSTDFDVFYSKGESGKDELYFQIKEYNSTSSANALSISRERFFDLKMLKKYIPGNPGTSGVFDRSSEAFKSLQISSGVVSTESDVDIYYSVNKDRIIVMFEYPIGIGENSLLFMIGKPDNQVSKYYADGAMMYFSTITLSGIVMVVDQADYVTNVVTGVSTYESIPPKFKNSKGTFFFSELAVGDAKEGFRALIDGVYVGGVDATLSGTALRNDFLIDAKGNKYKIFFLDTRPSNSYNYYVPSRYMALLIEEGVV